MTPARANGPHPGQDDRGAIHQPAADVDQGPMPLRGQDPRTSSYERERRTFFSWNVGGVPVILQHAWIPSSGATPFTGEQVWLGSLYLSTGVTAGVTDEEMKEVTEEPPATDLPILLAGDFNCTLKSGQMKGHIRAVPNNQKAHFVTDRLQRGIELRPPPPPQQLPQPAG